MTEELTWKTDLKSFTLLIILTLLQLSEKIIFHDAYSLITFCKQNPATKCCNIINLSCICEAYFRD